MQNSELVANKPRGQNIQRVIAHDGKRLKKYIEIIDRNYFKGQKPRADILLLLKLSRYLLQTGKKERAQGGNE